jgi:Phosphoglucomutase/phosphomannomutase, alpha/beta/alpha domain I
VIELTLRLDGYLLFFFRAKKMCFIAFRMGLLATLRSLDLLKRGSAHVVGIMITASHNPEPDNGVKLIDGNGEMLASEWEVFADILVNMEQSEFECFSQLCNSGFTKENFIFSLSKHDLEISESSMPLLDLVLEIFELRGSNMSLKPNVLVAGDTRYQRHCLLVI